MKVIVISLLVTSLLISCSGKGNNTIDLSGEWTFAADPNDKGVLEKWYTTTLDETVILPGSMTSNGKGNEIDLNTPWTGSIFDSSWFINPAMAKYRQPGNIKVPFWLQPDKYYVGAAWYRKEVIIPAAWKGQFIQLFLERCHWETRIWVDDHEAGMQNALGTPHIYDLTQWLAPGKHTIAICVDNRVKDIDVGRNSHSITDHTQTNWNGIVGKLELQSRPPIYVGDIQLYPDLQHKVVKVKLEIRNITGDPVQGKIKLQAKSLQITEKEGMSPMVKSVTIDSGRQTLELDYAMGDNPLLWDEFNPNLYDMTIQVIGDKKMKDTKDITFGMREFKTRGTQFTINGQVTFLRGTLECAIFPKTGYPPADTASWMHIFRIARAHGLNHMRFHSWCPPEAAFIAADHSGFYLQVECSSWANFGTTLGDGKPVDQFIYDESKRIVNAYGNHPSFCMLLYGNEPAGVNQEKWLGEFVLYWKNEDPRRLYSSGAGWPIIPETDFSSTASPRLQGWGEGLNSIINAQPPRTDYDWSNRITGFGKPVVSHEIGQWCVYPDFKEIALYTGVLKARNFEIFKESLEENHMGYLADSFLMASGKLQALCYKAEIEAALRTPGFGGFQLLDLHDFPGQGTALVGVLNPFWDEKGYISPKQYSRFCNATVPLVRLSKMIFHAGENLKAEVEIAHFGIKEIVNAIPTWKLSGSAGNIIFQGTLSKITIPLGNGIKLGEINQSLKAVDTPQKLTLTVTVGEFENSWDIWVYPASLPEIKEQILVTQKLDVRAADVLKKGGKVLLTLKKGSLKPDKGGSIAVGFSSIFWNTAWTNGQAPHTLGILCNPDHPALADFPTEFHSNWQWWDAMSNSNAIVLSDFPSNFKPIIRVIDDWFTNRPIALIFEAKVGDGKIIVSGVDLLKDLDKRPEARQLLYSLQHYMAGNSFNPSISIEMEKLHALLIK
jgi:hypothetical protein